MSKSEDEWYYEYQEEQWHRAHQIVDAVSRGFRLDADCILNKTRIRRQTEARLVAVWLVHTRTGLTDDDIAQMFNSSKSIVARATAFVGYCRRQHNTTYWTMGLAINEMYKY